MPVIGEPRQRRRVDRRRRRSRPAEADVVEHDDQDVGRILGQVARFGRRWCFESCKRGAATLADGDGRKRQDRALFHRRRGEGCCGKQQVPRVPTRIVLASI